MTNELYYVCSDGCIGGDPSSFIGTFTHRRQRAHRNDLGDLGDFNRGRYCAICAVFCGSAYAGTWSASHLPNHIYIYIYLCICVRYFGTQLKVSAERDRIFYIYHIYRLEVKDQRYSLSDKFYFWNVDEFCAIFSENGCLWKRSQWFPIYLKKKEEKRISILKYNMCLHVIHSIKYSLNKNVLKSKRPNQNRGPRSIHNITHILPQQPIS